MRRIFEVVSVTFRIRLGIVLLLCTIGTSAFAQFGGLLVLGGNHSSNVTGTEDALSDNAFTPALVLQYRIPFSRLAKLDLGATATSSIYSNTPDLSYSKFFLSATGKFYLSEDTRKFGTSEWQAEQSITLPKVKRDSTVTTLLSEITMTFEDSLVQLSSSMNALSLRLDTTTVSAAHMPKKALLSESLAALSAILAEESYTESVRSVVLEELAADQAFVTGITFSGPLTDSLPIIFREYKRVLERNGGQSDFLSVPPSASNPVNGQQSVQPGEKPTSEFIVPDAPVITLVDASTDGTNFGSSSVSVREDLSLRTSLTLATLLEVPIELEHQSNHEAYKEYSYSQLSLVPQVSFYPSDNIGLGGLYGFSSNNYPNDSLFTYREHRLGINGKLGFGSAVVIGFQGGISFRKYPNSRTDTIRTPKGPVIERGGQDFSEQQASITSTLFLSKRLSVGIGGALTRSPQLRSYLIDSPLGRTASGGKASDDPFSYEMSKVLFYLTSRLPLDINVGLDIAREERTYGTGINRKLDQKLEARLTRTDNGTIVSVDLTRDFIFEDKLIGIFDAITPEVYFQYQDYTSTIELFTYNSVAVSLSVNALF